MGAGCPKRAGPPVELPPNMAPPPELVPRVEAPAPPKRDYVGYDPVAGGPNRPPPAPVAYTKLALIRFITPAPVDPNKDVLG